MQISLLSCIEFALATDNCYLINDILFFTTKKTQEMINTLKKKRCI